VPLNAANSADVRQLYQPLRLSPTYHHHHVDQTAGVKVDPMADCVEIGIVGQVRSGYGINALGSHVARAPSSSRS
jgi:hypothetical protein